MMIILRTMLRNIIKDDTFVLMNTNLSEHSTRCAQGIFIDDCALVTDN